MRKTRLIVVKCESSWVANLKVEYLSHVNRLPRSRTRNTNPPESMDVSTAKSKVSFNNPIHYIRPFGYILGVGFYPALNRQRFDLLRDVSYDLASIVPVWSNKHPERYGCWTIKLSDRGYFYIEVELEFWVLGRIEGLLK